MDGGVGPNAGGAADTADTAADTPLHDSDFSPVGSPDAALHDVHGLPSDEDHDHDHEEDADADADHNQDQDQPPGPNHAEVLKNKIIKQVEYYFSDENLPTDKHMIGLIKKNKQGFVPIAMIASFRKMKKLTRDPLFIVNALKESSLLVVSSDGKKVKRLSPFPLSEIRDPKLCTVLVENLPEDHSVENIRRIFGGAGKIKHISVRDPHILEETRKGNKADTLLSSKLHALVEYDSVEAAEKAAASLNNEQDWRNGLRVKLLKKVVKHGQRRQHWKESDFEKNSNAQASNQMGDEENHHPAERHTDTPDEEDVENASKDKNGNKGRNRGRPRKNYRTSNGIGHGSTSHAVEPSKPKPPPGPKMPDGTRGFTMGRGRPLVSN